ncbi:hypothetical protein JOB18_011957 [Solea senegalensis]|uniref:Uncharacterized protein n=1 Tax=Solea senegalensis TaxID=28829 RepID=A0AAV6PEI8_SOLSE|nr:hypothetical protein JOB18_011957 [Solea senegalensis]
MATRRHTRLHAFLPNAKDERSEERLQAMTHAITKLTRSLLRLKMNESEEPLTRWRRHTKLPQRKDGTKVKSARQRMTPPTYTFLNAKR